LFIGHGLLAFALAVLFAQWRGWSTERAFALGIATGAFAALPDIDVLYAATAMHPTALVVGTESRPGEFWGAANGAHRLLTHSLVVAAVAGPAFALWTLGVNAERQDWLPERPRGALAAGLASLALAGLVAATVAASGIADALVMAAFVVVGLGIAAVARSRLGLRPRTIALAAVAGIASHPWGDLVTGEPPVLLYPFDVAVLTERVALSGDPTLHLLGAFALELGAVALAAAVVARHSGFAPHRLVDRRALLGAVYGVGAVVMAPPTIHLSYQFVFSILAVGGVCGTVRRSPRGWYPLRRAVDRLAGTREAALRTTMTTLAGIAVALVSYGAMYLLVG
jgi:membrane-bound metal-dependent hydrolase YbcI (DUF457 family)